MDEWRSGLTDEDRTLLAALEAGEGRTVTRGEAEAFLEYAGSLRYLGGLDRMLYDLLTEGLLAARGTRSSTASWPSSYPRGRPRSPDTMTR